MIGQVKTSDGKETIVAAVDRPGSGRESSENSQQWDIVEKTTRTGNEKKLPKPRHSDYSNDPGSLQCKNMPNIDTICTIDKKCEIFLLIFDTF